MFCLLVFVPQPASYILYVLFLSLTLDLPRFFEFKVVHRDGRLRAWTTALMENPEYIR